MVFAIEKIFSTTKTIFTVVEKMVSGVPTIFFAIGKIFPTAKTIFREGVWAFPGL